MEGQRPKTEPVTESPEPVTERRRTEEPVTERRRTEMPVMAAERRRMEAERRRMEAERRRTEMPVMGAERRRMEAERRRAERRRTSIFAADISLSTEEVRMEGPVMEAERRRTEMPVMEGPRMEGPVMEAERWRLEVERLRMRMMLMGRTPPTGVMPSPIEDEMGMGMRLRTAEMRLREAERWIKADRQRMEAERRTVEAELRRLQPEKQRPEWERVSMELSSMSRRVAWEAMTEKAEAEREARMEKAEAEAERMKSLRQMPRRRRRVEMDEDMIEAKMAEERRVELQREAKRAELERERYMDEQRMMAEVAELEMLLAEFEMEEAEMEAEEKRVDEGIRIFQVWWHAWKQAKKQETEDCEWIKTWAQREIEIFSVRRPLALMALWEEWESNNDDLFIQCYTSICEEKANELLRNNWKKVNVFHQEFDDLDLVTHVRKYTDFRNSWEDKYSHENGCFEDITKERCMLYSRGPVSRLMFKGPRPKTLQIFSVKIKIGSLNGPLQVYGLIAIRDFIDPQRNMIFNRDRNEYQVVTEEDPYLTLTGPTRSVVLDMNESMGPVTIEAELKVRMALESEDKYIILDAISLPNLVGSRSFELSGPQKLEILVGAIQKSVEATIFIRLIDGIWPNDFHGQFVGKTASMECNEVMLLEFGGDGKINQSRSVISVEASGVLIITLKASSGEEVRCVVFNAASSGRSFETLDLGSCRVQILVAWSLIPPYCQELVPLKLNKLYNV